MAKKKPQRTWMMSESKPATAALSESAKTDLDAIENDGNFQLL